jgi:hypothetical protein
VDFQVACLFLFREGGFTFWETCENISLLLSNPGRRFVSPLLEGGLQVGGGWKRPHKYEDNDDLPVEQCAEWPSGMARPPATCRVLYLFPFHPKFLLCPGTKDAHASLVLASPYPLQFSILRLCYAFFFTFYSPGSILSLLESLIFATPELLFCFSPDLTYVFPIIPNLPIPSF